MGPAPEPLGQLEQGKARAAAEVEDRAPGGERHVLEQEVLAEGPLRKFTPPARGTGGCYQQPAKVHPACRAQPVAVGRSVLREPPPGLALLGRPPLPV